VPKVGKRNLLRETLQKMPEREKGTDLRLGLGLECDGVRGREVVQVEVVIPRERGQRAVALGEERPVRQLERVAARGSLDMGRFNCFLFVFTRKLRN
jgi:hypothetical protein